MDPPQRLWCRPCQNQFSDFERDRYAPCEYGQCLFIKTENVEAEPAAKKTKTAVENQATRLTSTPTDVQVITLITKMQTIFEDRNSSR